MVLLTYEIYGAMNEWSRSQTNARGWDSCHSQDVKVELGTEASMEGCGSYCPLIGVATSTWLDLSASGWHMHEDSMQGLCLYGYRH